MCFVTSLHLEGAVDKRPGKVPFSANAKIFSVLRKAFFWWSDRIIKHANRFEAFVRVATRRTPNAFKGSQQVT